MVETKTGLPNSCTICAKPCVSTWFARNEDIARSGGGICADCLIAESAPSQPSSKTAVAANTTGADGASAALPLPITFDDASAEPPLPIFLQEPRTWPLTSVKGLGLATAKKLEAAGVYTHAELLDADTARLAAVTGITQGKLRSFVDELA